MPSDFVLAARAAQERLPVPEVPLTEIRERAARESQRSRVHALVTWGIVIALALGVGTAYGQRVYEGVRLWLFGGRAAVSITGFAVVRMPMASDVRAVASRTTFPVIFPMSLPKGTRLNMMMYAPADHPTMITMLYGGQSPLSARGGFSLWDSSTVNNPSTLPGGLTSHSVTEWRVGSETVLVPQDKLPPAVLSQVKSAMLRATAAQSLSATEAMGRRVWLEGGAYAVAAEGEELAPDGAGVLLDGQRIGLIPRLASQQHPLIDSRTVFLTDIPTVNGEPDYSKATLHWPRPILIPAAGVRAIDALLRVEGIGPKCACGLLFDGLHGRAYPMWVIGLAGPHRARAYSVDASTLRVTRVQ